MGALNWFKTAMKLFDPLIITCQSDYEPVWIMNRDYFFFFFFILFKVHNFYIL